MRQELIIICLMLMLLTVVRFTLPVHATPTIDGKQTFTCSSSSTTQSVTFSTVTQNDIRILGVQYIGTATITGVADSQTLTWTARLNGGNSAVKTGEFYATGSPSGSDTITVTFNTAVSNCALLAFGVTGIDQTIPFDGTAQGTQSSSASSLSVTIVTNHATDLAIGIGGGGSSGFTFSPATGFTTVDITTAQVFGEYENLLTAQSGLTVSVSRNGVDAMAMIGDALCVSPCAPTIGKLSPASGQIGSYVEIDGQAFTSLTSITFCSITAVTFIFVSDQIVRVYAPPVPIGTRTCDVQITTPLGSSSVTTQDQFSYVDSGSVPSPSPIIQSIPGPGGVPIPPQFADQNVLGYVFLLSAAIALSSIRLERKKKTDRRLRLG